MSTEHGEMGDATESTRQLHEHLRTEAVDGFRQFVQRSVGCLRDGVALPPMWELGLAQWFDRTLWL